MTRFPAALTIVLVASSLLAADGQKVIRLQPAVAPIAIDGVVEPAWASADSVSDFVQLQPFAGKDPSRRTVVRVLTTNEALYCLIVAYSDPREIQTNTGTLDDYGGDVVSLMIDTFGDRRTAYKFAVTAAGVRGDCRLLDDARNRDYSWDGVWFSAAKVYDWGYVVEMEVPYRSIQYDERLTSWGVDFDRWIPALTQDIYWNRYEENEGQRISKFGRLEFESVRPSVKGENLEIYPVALSKAEMVGNGPVRSTRTVYHNTPTAGLDLFYNPSPKLTVQFTANPDFAQIEADPFAFNISRYETYFNERRPFFTQGNEVFTASGRQRNIGFYQPMELFYSRRIGKKLPDGSEVPLLVGAKVFGRADDWEYGGFMSFTGEENYLGGGLPMREPSATFAAARVKRQIFENSSIGLFYVGKQDGTTRNGVIDIDGAFRTSTMQLAYQLARSYYNGTGGYAASAGLTQMTDDYMAFARVRSVGSEFDISQVGFVPWKGTTEFTGLAGPRWYFPEGAVSSIMLYAGPTLYYEKVDAYTDYAAVLGYNMQFRANWGFEVDLVGGRSKDQDKVYDSYSLNYSVWMNVSPKWNLNTWGGVQRTYNFDRSWLGPYAWAGLAVDWKAADIFSIGTSGDVYLEGNPSGGVEEVTVNTRPYLSLTPMNNLNVRLYVDNVYLRSSDKLEQVVGGLLFSYNFLPKSWIYFALNEVRDRSIETDSFAVPLPPRIHPTARAAVLKVKYLYYL